MLRFLLPLKYLVVIHEHANIAWLSNVMQQSEVRPLLLSSAIVIGLVLGFPLEIVGKMASMAFLLLFGVITIGHLRIRQQTGTSAVILWCGVLINLSLFAFLFIDGITTEPSGVIVLVAALLGTFLFQLLYHFMQLKKN